MTTLKYDVTPVLPTLALSGCIPFQYGADKRDVELPGGEYGGRTAKAIDDTAVLHGSGKCIPVETPC
jgi:hypothetical protein